MVFFDDILICSANIEDHVVHLRKVFYTVRCNSLFAKKIECFFALDRVEYLGHFIFIGISTDPRKIEAMRNCLIPSNNYKDFWDCRFVKGLGWIAKPLIDLLRKDKFLWTQSSY